jgi:hypothetical protein
MLLDGGDHLDAVSENGRTVISVVKDGLRVCENNGQINDDHSSNCKVFDFEFVEFRMSSHRSKHFLSNWRYSEDLLLSLLSGQELNSEKRFRNASREVF